MPKSLPEGGLSITLATSFYRGFKRSSGLRAALRRPRTRTPVSFQIWAGDNVYLDVPPLEELEDPYLQTLERYLEYLFDEDYTLARRGAPNFTVYDDHEFWNNYLEPQFWLTQSDQGEASPFARAALDFLEFFQASCNPRPVGEGEGGADVMLAGAGSGGPACAA